MVETVLAVGALAASAIGTGVSAMGAIQQGKATQAASDYQSQVAANNARIAEQQRRTAVASGEAQGERQQMANAERRNAILAAQASSGVDVTSGSPAAVQRSQQEIGDLDVSTVRNNAARVAYGYQTQALSDTAQSDLASFTGENAAKAGRLGAFTSILGGATSVGKQYADWKRVGVF